MQVLLCFWILLQLCRVSALADDYYNAQMIKQLADGHTSTVHEQESQGGT